MAKTECETAAKTVVCVTDQRQCDRIIRVGKKLADLSGGQLAVISVVDPNRRSDPDSMEYLFSVSRENGAEMVLLYSDDVARSIIKYIKSNKVSTMLTGIPCRGDSVTADIWNKFTHIDFFVVEMDGSLRPVSNPVRAARELCIPVIEGI